jgi:hypothetical protein
LQDDEKYKDIKNQNEEFKTELEEIKNFLNWM